MTILAAGTSCRYARTIKRVTDVVGSVVLLVATAPVQALVAAAIVLSSGRPIFFHQERSGRAGVPFWLHKFRTMTVGTEEKSQNFPTPDMVTPVGRVLRRFSLDEIPQLVNILRGEMSFVGPRPALPSQVMRYTDDQQKRLMVRPGLTGLAQIRFRNNAPWSQRIEADLEYIDRLSLGLDLRILAATLPKALLGTDQVVGQVATDVDDLAVIRQER